MQTAKHTGDRSLAHENLLVLVVWCLIASHPLLPHSLGGCDVFCREIAAQALFGNLELVCHVSAYPTPVSGDEFHSCIGRSPMCQKAQNRDNIENRLEIGLLQNIYSLTVISQP